MSRADKNTERYAGGTIRLGAPTKTGIPQFFATTYVSGERRRALFRDKQAARTWLEVQRSDLPRLTSLDLIDAARAIAILPPGVSLLETVKYYVEYHKPIPTISLADGFSEWLGSKQHALRPTTLQWYKNLSAAMCSRLGENTPISTLTTKMLESSIEIDKPSVRNANIRALSAFLAWSLQRGYITSNPAAALVKSRLTSVKRAILTLEQARAVLGISSHDFPFAVPYFAVGMFAGVRPFETLRLKREHFANGYIRIGSDIAKTSTSERTIPITQNLDAWLRAFPISESGVYPADAPFKLDWCLRSTFRRAGVSDHKDIMRHSFASYLYDLTHDAARVASELGHTNTTMLFKHYRGLVPPGDGKRYFAIIP